MKQKAKKQAQMLKKVAEQMDEQDEELKKRLVSNLRGVPVQMVENQRILCRIF